MVERQDIDALLISALYGELTPAEETRLAAHLDSHPADRSALADLTATRAQVHESRILQVQAEPPQSVSAILLQEAARRAPRKAEARDEGWFQRFVRSFMAHPALAAAAMLVVVVGFAALISSRKGDQFAESTAPSAAQREHAISSEGGAGSVALPESTTVASPTPPRDLADGKDQIAEPTANVQAGPGAAAGSAYGVGLADEEPTKALGYAKNERAEQQVRKIDNAAKGGGGDLSRSPNHSPAPTVAKPTPAKDPSYIELRTQEPGPKELDTPKLSKQKAPAAAVKKDSASFESDAVDDSGGNSVGTGRTVDRAGTSGAMAPTGGGAGAGTAPTGRLDLKPAAKVASDKPADTKVAPAKVAPAKPAAKPVAPARNTLEAAHGSAPGAVTASPSPPPPPPVQAPATDKTRTAPDAGKSEEKPDPQYAWASQMHQRVISQVKANNCKEAASLAQQIYSRAPSYYAQNVATDRQLKDCLAYINNEREKDAEAKRARQPQKRAGEESPSPAPTQPKAATDAAH